MKLGIGSWTYPWAIGVKGYDLPKQPLTAVGLIKRASEIGVHVVQICDNLPLHLLSMEELLEIRQAAKDCGIVIETGTRGVEPEHLLRYLEIAKILDAKLLRTIIDVASTAEGINQARVWIKEVLPSFEKAGVVIGIENHERHLTKDLAGLVCSLDSPCIGICLDTVNSFGAQECPEQVIRELAPYTVCLHFKDFNISRVDYGMGLVITGCPAGEGRLDVEYLIKILEQHGREFNIILEQWPPYLGSVEHSIRNEEVWAHRSICYLKRLFG